MSMDSSLLVDSSVSVGSSSKCDGIAISLGLFGNKLKPCCAVVSLKDGNGGSSIEYLSPSPIWEVETGLSGLGALLTMSSGSSPIGHSPFVLE